jgi:hypothetical protein
MLLSSYVEQNIKYHTHTHKTQLYLIPVYFKRNTSISGHKYLTARVSAELPLLTSTLFSWADNSARNARGLVVMCLVYSHYATKCFLIY